MVATKRLRGGDASNRCDIQRDELHAELDTVDAVVFSQDSRDNSTVSQLDCGVLTDGLS